MIIAEQAAEQSGEITIQEHLEVGGLPHKIGSYYNESLIINYLNEAVYAVDYKNRKVLIQQHPASMYDRKLEIRCRAISSEARRYDPNTYLETTKCKHDVITIPYGTLRREPVFVEELNAVLCFGDQLSIIKHPHSQKGIDERIEIAISEKVNVPLEAPFYVYANDPSGKLSVLFMEINGKICETVVTNFTHESDRIIVAFRDKPGSVEDFTKHYTSFTELLTQDPHIWSFCGLRMSTSKEWFEQVLEIERNKKPTCIEVKTVDALIKQSCSEAEDKIKCLTEENREMTSRLKKLEATNEALKEGDYNGKKAEYDFKKLELEQAKIRQAETQAKLALHAEKLKFRKEVVTVLGVVAKTAAIIVPLSIGVYKAIKAARSQ